MKLQPILAAKPLAAAPAPPAAPRCREIYQRRLRILETLDRELTEAKEQTRAAMDKPAAAAIAWDIVEEISQKLSRLEAELKECVVEYAYLERTDRDQALSQRVYE